MANKNDAKRLPLSAVLTLGAMEDGRHIAGFIEGNIAIDRVMIVVSEAFNGTTPTITIEETVDGNTGTWLSGGDLSSTAVITATPSIPDGTNGTRAPSYNSGKSQWDLILVGGSTVGELMVVIEYTQLDTEPGLHSSTNA